MLARLLTCLLLFVFSCFQLERSALADETNTAGEQFVVVDSTNANGSTSAPFASSSTDQPSSRSNPGSDQRSMRDQQSIEERQPDPFKYVGNTFSSKFHRPSCPFAKCISHRHLVFFGRRFNAVDAGYKPCQYCLPPDWKTVHLVVLGHRDGESSGEKPDRSPALSKPVGSTVSGGEAASAAR